MEQEQRPGKRERAGRVSNSVDVRVHVLDMRQIGTVVGAEDLKEPARGCVLPRSWLGWGRTQRPRVPAHLRRQRLVGGRRTRRRDAFRSKRCPPLLYHGRARDISGFVRRPHLHVTSSAAHSMVHREQGVAWGMRRMRGLGMFPARTWQRGSNLRGVVHPGTTGGLIGSKISWGSPNKQKHVFCFVFNKKTPYKLPCRAAMP